MFRSFSAPNLRGRLADRHQTLPHVRWQPRFTEFSQKFGGPKTSNFSAISDNLRNATRHCQSENCVANDRHSRTGKLNLVYFGPQMAKNRSGVLTHTLAIVQMTGINNSVALARWQQWAAIKLGIGMHSSYYYNNYNNKGQSNSAKGGCWHPVLSVHCGWLNMTLRIPLLCLAPPSVLLQISLTRLNA